MVSIELPPNYGIPLAISLGAIPLLGWIHGLIVTTMRRGAKVPYPHCYATLEQCATNPKAEQFNNAQRAHSNFLENAPQTMLYTLVAGLKWPNATAAVASVWLVARIFYLRGYVYSGQARGNGRFQGSLFWPAQGMLWGMTLFGVAKELISF